MNSTAVTILMFIQCLAVSLIASNVGEDGLQWDTGNCGTVGITLIFFRF